MLTLRKKTRIIFISAISALAAAMAVLAVIVYAFPGYQTTVDKTLEAQASAEIVYSVLMNENPVYDEKIVTDEKYYLKPFTSYLDIDCSLKVTTEAEAQIDCTSEIYGLLISEVTTDAGTDIVWDKRYDYALNLKRSEMGTDAHLTRGIYVSLDEYEQLAETLMDEYSIYTDYYLRIMFDSEVTVSVGEQSKTEHISTYMDVPFTNNVMQIENASPENVSIYLEKETTEKKQPRSDLGFLFILLFVTFALCLLLVIFKTKGIDKQDKFTNQVEKIFKEYGNRLAGLTDTLAYQSSVMISIDKIDDMVKIADEIGQTIFYYEVDEEEERKIEFYVFDEGRIYYLVIFGKLME